jgi:hypothetical protein
MARTVKDWKHIITQNGSNLVSEADDGFKLHWKPTVVTLNKNPINIYMCNLSCEVMVQSSIEW